MSFVAASSPPLLRKGDLVAGKYRVEDVLGEGGMGVVFAATHEELEQRVAIKVLQPAVTADREILERFLREARAAARLDTEHAVRVYDVGRLESGAPYMVMERLEGEDLAQSLERRGPLPISEAVGYVLEALEGLSAAHAAGIVHRDVKPSNFFIAARPNGKPLVKVLDFGISKLESATRDQVALTGTRAIMGSPGYMSPEQLVSAKSVDARADVWGVGVALHEVITGKMPFWGDSMPELVAAILATPHATLAAVRPDAPPGLQAVLDRCFAKDPAARFPDVATLARALAPFGPPRSDEAVARIARTLGLAMEPSPPPDPAGALRASSADLAHASEPVLVAAALTGTHGLPRAAGRGALLAIGGVLLLLGAGAAVLVVSRGSEAARPAATPTSAAVTTAPGPAATPTSSIAPEPSPTTTASAETLAPLASASASAEPNAAPSVPRALPLAAPPAPAPAASTKPACRTVSYFDDSGNKHFKLVCP